ncbi:MAG: hypothetical protein GEU86_04895 [Actinophytocola sp.]|nr:hypothetical protein [Actinophytocola sp.]
MNVPMRALLTVAIAGLLVLDAVAVPAAGARVEPSPAPAPPAPDRAASPEDRYAMAGGCYAVRSLAADRYLTRSDDGFAATAAAVTEAEPFHFQATDLGRYLLFGTAEDFLAVSDGLVGEVAGEVTDSSPGALVGGLTREQSDAVLRELAEGELGTASGRGSTVGIAAEPSELADWEIEESGEGFRIWLPALDKDLTVGDDGQLGLTDPGGSPGFGFELLEGCAAWPEADVNVTGPVAGGETPYTEVRGYLDPHLHGMAFEFLGGRLRCGRPWHPYGVTFALRGCKEHEASGGRTHVMETILSGRDPVQGHDTTGWPTFVDWPAHDSLAYEQTYYRWIERAWRGGLRMYTNLLVDNNKLCEVYPIKRNSCNEMDGVRLQAQRLREFERYIDAQNGGPGRGWFRIVTDPFEARRVMNAGKLAVVMGIEVSVLFDCGVQRGTPECDEQQVDEQLAEVHELGVRQMELVNKFDNAFTGVAGDAGSTGVAVNGANFMQTGSFWRMGSCEGHSDHSHDQPQANLHDDAGTPEELTGRDALAGAVLEAVGESGAAPVYGGGPHCNQAGLTELGKYTIRRMAEHGMIFDPDHMSAKARRDAMDFVIDELAYSGVVSSHSWADDDIYRRVYEAGGVVTPMAGSSTRFAERWRQHKQWADDRFYFGFGWGSDINGFASQGAPRGADTDNPVTYPFTGFGGARIDRQVSGERVFDINTDGVAHYGLYLDWVQDLRLLAGDAIVADLERGPEAYLQMWERAVGIAGDSCRDDIDELTRQDLKRVERGMPPEDVLFTLGQPHARDRDTFTYCLAGGKTAQLRFDDDGRLR